MTTNGPKWVVRKLKRITNQLSTQDLDIKCQLSRAKIIVLEDVNTHS